MKSLASSASFVDVGTVLAVKRSEERFGALTSARVIGTDDLRQRMQLFQSVPFRDALGTERDIHPATARSQMLPNEARRTRIDRASQDDERAVPEVRRDLVDGLLEDGHRGSQEFVDRRSNDDDQLVGAADHLGIGAELQPARR